MKRAKVVGAGMFGCACARTLAEAGFSVDVAEARGEIGGNCSTYEDSGIEVHKYGSHIFHTSDEDVWRFVNRFAEFNGYRHQVLAEHAGRRYFLPFGLPLLNAFFGREMTPSEALEFMESARASAKQPPSNLEEQAVAFIGREIYEAFVRNYTAKQWHADPKDLDPSIIRRIPVRTTYDVSYFDDRRQGIPVGGYQRMFEKMLDHPAIFVYLNTRYTEADLAADAAYDAIVYTGPLDELFGYRRGALQWRSLRFETEKLPVADFQGTAVVNYVDAEPAYTRIHEFRHYHPERPAPSATVVQREYPADWELGAERYYPVDTAQSRIVQAAYLEEASKYKNLRVGGRLGLYRYLDMDDAVAAALDMCRNIADGA